MYMQNTHHTNMSVSASQSVTVLKHTWNTIYTTVCTGRAWFSQYDHMKEQISYSDRLQSDHCLICAHIYSFYSTEECSLAIYTHIQLTVTADFDECTGVQMDVFVQYGCSPWLKASPVQSGDDCIPSDRRWPHHSTQNHQNISAGPSFVEVKCQGLERIGK